MKRRLFIAIDFPKTTKRRLTTISNKLNHQYPQGRWERGDKLHLTLKFLGYTEVPVEVIQAAIIKKLAYTHEFDLVFGNLGVFNRSHSSVVFIDIITGEELLSLYHKINNALAEWFVRDERPFHPHVTLARLKIYRELKIPQLSERQIPQPINIQKVTIFSSQLTRTGSIYQIQAQISLLSKSCQNEYNKIPAKS